MAAHKLYCTDLHFGLLVHHDVEHQLILFGCIILLNNAHFGVVEPFALVVAEYLSLGSIDQVIGNLSANQHHHLLLNIFLFTFADAMVIFGCKSWPLLQIDVQPDFITNYFCRRNFYI